MPWPEPTHTLARSFTVAVSPNINLQVTPTYFHQESCRHFLSRAYSRLLHRMFTSHTGDPITYGLWDNDIPPTPSTATLPILRLRVEPKRLLHNDLLSTVSSWCNNQGALLPHVLSDSGLDESYTLNITTASIDIAVQSPVGVLRAFSTLSQLVDWNGQAHVITVKDPHVSCGGKHAGKQAASSTQDVTQQEGATSSLCDSMDAATLLQLTDGPRYPWRGLMLDTARHYYPISALKRIINGMELLKMNVFHWHIVDAQSFPFVSTTFPKLSQAGAYANTPAMTYRPQDIQDFIAYCTERGVRVVPEFDCPGHTASWGRGYPELELTVMCPTLINLDAGPKVPMREHGIDRVALNPLRNSTYVFLKQFFKEIFATFPDPVLHIGGDEVDKNCWLTDPLIAEYASNNGPTWARKLQAEFEAKLVDILHKGGKSAMVWDEVLGSDGVTYELPKDTIVQWWRGWISSVPSKSTRLGHRYVQSAPWYLDHVGDDWLKMYKARIDDKMYGGEACSWSEHANEMNTEHRIFSRLPSIAERLWSTSEFTENAVQSSTVAETARRLGGILCRLNKRVGLRVAPAYPDYCGVVLSSSSSGEALTSNHTVSPSIDEMEYKNMAKAMREWQFAAFLLGALVLFGIVACLAFCISKKCPKANDHRKNGRRRRHGQRKTLKFTEFGRNSGGGLSGSGVGEDDEEEGEGDREDVEMTGLL